MSYSPYDPNHYFHHNYKDFQFPVYVPNEELDWKWLTQRKYLPSRGGIYVVHFRESSDALYIGQSFDLHNRWNYPGQEHHVLCRIRSVVKDEEQFRSLRIYYCCAPALQNTKFREETEARLIKDYNPKFNIIGKRKEPKSNKLGLVRLVKASEDNEAEGSAVHPWLLEGDYKSNKQKHPQMERLKQVGSSSSKKSILRLAE